MSIDGCDLCRAMAEDDGRLAKALEAMTTEDLRGAGLGLATRLGSEWFDTNEVHAHLFEAERAAARLKPEWPWPARALVDAVPDPERPGAKRDGTTHLG